VDAQRAVIAILRKQVHRLEKHEVPLEDLVVARRISRDLSEFNVATLAHAALLRGRLHGVTIPPGGKVRFAVIASTGTIQHERVILLEELLHTTVRSERADVEHYRALALRAIWAILAPFGWDEEEITIGQRRITLQNYL
jgi:DNA polymerase elongation subunit (family B)